MCKNREEEFLGSHVLIFLAVQCLHEGTQMLLLWMQIGSAAEIVPWYHCWGFAAAAPSCRVDSSQMSVGEDLCLRQRKGYPYPPLALTLIATDPVFFFSVNEDWPVFSFGRALIFKAQCVLSLCFAWFSIVDSVMYLHGFATFLALFNWMKITWGSVSPLCNLSHLHPVVKNHCSCLLNLSFSCVNY